MKEIPCHPDGATATEGSARKERAASQPDPSQAQDDGLAPSITYLGWTRLIVISFTGLSSLSTNLATAALGPSPWVTANSRTFTPFFSVSAGDLSVSFSQSRPA